MTNYRRRYESIVTFTHYWWECTLVQALRITVWHYQLKWKIYLCYDPIGISWVINRTEMCEHVQKWYEALFITAKN